MFAAPHDAGTAIGAALEAARRIAGPGASAVGAVGPSLTPFLGGEFDDDAIDAALARWGLAWERAADAEARAASLLADGRIVAWFQGRMEFGPRRWETVRSWQIRGGWKCAKGSTAASSIGNRSGHLPLRSWRKRRRRGLSSLRTGSGRGLRETSCSWPIPSAPTRRSRIPAVVHADGTCRIQTVSRAQPRFHRLISAFFQRTGAPVVLNTSYNEQEPLVLTPDDALATFLKTDIDALFLNDRLVVRQRVGPEASSPVSRNASTRPVRPSGRAAPAGADAGPVRRSPGAGLWQPRSRRAVPAVCRGEVSLLRYRGGRGRRVHFGIESPTAGMVSAALPPGFAGSGASRYLQFRFIS